MFRDRLSSAQHPLSSPVEKTSYSEGISICHQSSVSRSHRLHFFSANLSVHTVSGRWQTVAQRAPVGGTPLAAASPPGYVCFVYRTLHKRSRLETYRGCVYMNMNMFCVTPRCVCVCAWHMLCWCKVLSLQLEPGGAEKAAQVFFTLTLFRVA